MTKKETSTSSPFKSWYNCQLADASQEKSFRASRISPDIKLSRFGYLVAIVLYSAFYFVILPIIAADSNTAYTTIYYTMLISSIGSAVLTFSEHYRPHAKLFAVAQAIIITLGFFAGMLTLPTIAHLIIYAAGLPIAGVFFILGLTWFQAFFISLISFFTTLIIIVYLQISIENYAFGLFSLLGFIIISSIGANRVEIQNRLTFVANKKSTQLIEQLTENEQSLYELSITDGLTEIFNRRHFDNVGPTKLQDVKRLNSSMHLLMLDIDHFKLYNDHYGHPEGDEVLKVVSAALRNLLRRSTDQVFRVGGEEFAIIMLSDKLEEALLLTELIHNKIKSLKIVNEKSPTSDYITVSIGASSTNRLSNESFDELYQHADKALYLAKQSGRNKTSFY
ncbi:MAG: hypothetical protein COB26_10725 [Piscirickettsiaceae bacterium]|nr:MAG: hypothetical protein COB89_06370 [Piscirickettsiaceae bacterium]PCI66806.1 MAG: hypothetical protein COB26_10725 [Piscirickettsiaceae bacterium]